jgi:galactokinase
MDIADLISRFNRAFAQAPAFVARAPGRVNLIGEHTDYNGGFVLPMAIDRDVTIVGAPRDDRTVRLHSANFDDDVAFALDHIDKLTKNTWSNYSRGVADVLQKSGRDLNGFSGVLYGNVPIGSGLSSSAATEMSTVMAFAAATPSLNVDGVTAAKLSQKAENEFVGVNCGIMDQFISSLGQAGHALFIDCLSLDYELVPMPGGVTVLVVDTSAPRSLAASAYNERRAQCEFAAGVFGVKTLREMPVEAFERRQGELPDDVAKRVSHVIHENQRVLDAVAALRAGDVVRFGQLMNQSHDSLRNLYEVSSTELDAVVNIAREMRGVHGARMTGAGFGGCAIALVENDCADALAARMRDEYPRRTGREPKVYACVASDGASWQSL